MLMITSRTRVRLPPLPVSARTTEAGASYSYILTNRKDPTYSSIWPSEERKNIVPISSGALWWYMSDKGVNDPVAANYVPQSSNPSNAPPTPFETDIVSQLKQQTAPQLTVLIHGLDNEWTDAINTTATFGANLASVGYRGLVIGFDWPSYGSDASFAYYASGYRPSATSGSIRDNINGSVTAFGHMIGFIQSLRSMVPGLTVTLACHSEGNFMAMLGTASMSSVLIDQVVLLAADINNGAFQADTGADAGQAAKVATLSTRVTVYYTNNDDILAGSQGVYQPFGYHNPVYGGRLGQTGPAYNQGKQQANMVSVDCSAVLNELALQNDPNVPSDMSLHSSYFYVTQVLQDIAATLIGKASGNVINRTAAANPNDFFMTPVPTS